MSGKQTHFDGARDSFTGDVINRYPVTKMGGKIAGILAAMSTVQLHRPRYSLCVQLDVLLASVDVEGVARLQVVPLEHLQPLDGELGPQPVGGSRDDAVVDQARGAEQQQVRELVEEQGVR